VPVERRAGMLTSYWFLVFNDMFTALPRTAAAQSYRAYLGYEIAQQQALFPVNDEPVDYDLKGVTQAECAHPSWKPVERLGQPTTFDDRPHSVAARSRVGPVRGASPRSDDRAGARRHQPDSGRRNADRKEA
jgi:hypothetical protein